MVDEKNTLLTRIYCVRDDKLNNYECIFTCKDSEFDELVIAMTNDVSSKYYRRPDEYSIWYLGDFMNDSGLIVNQQITKRCDLNEYVDQRRRDIQMCMQALNYLPQGYFKMPAEMQKDIQKTIDEYAHFYAKEFVADTIDKCPSSASTGV